MFAFYGRLFGVLVLTSLLRFEFAVSLPVAPEEDNYATSCMSLDSQAVKSSALLQQDDRTSTRYLQEPVVSSSILSGPIFQLKSWGRNCEECHAAAQASRSGQVPGHDSASFFQQSSSSVLVSVDTGESDEDVEKMTSADSSTTKPPEGLDKSQNFSELEALSALMQDAATVLSNASASQEQANGKEADQTIPKALATSSGTVREQDSAAKPKDKAKEGGEPALSNEELDREVMQALADISAEDLAKPSLKENHVSKGQSDGKLPMSPTAATAAQTASSQQKPEQKPQTLPEHHQKHHHKHHHRSNKKQQKQQKQQQAKEQKQQQPPTQSQQKQQQQSRSFYSFTDSGGSYASGFVKRHAASLAAAAGLVAATLLGVTCLATGFFTAIFLRHDKDPKPSLRAEVEALPRCSSFDVLRMVPCQGGYDTAFSKPISSKQLVRLEVRVEGASRCAALTAPLTGRSCVLHSAAVSRQIHDGMPPVPMAFSASSGEFIATLLDDPTVNITINGASISLFDMSKGRVVEQTSFANAPDTWQDFVLTHRSASPAGNDWAASSALRADPAMLEFQEFALLIGSTITVVGELHRDSDGELSLRPWLRPGTAGDFPGPNRTMSAGKREPWRTSWEGTPPSSSKSCKETKQEVSNILREKVLASDDELLLQPELGEEGKLNRECTNLKNMLVNC